MPLSIRKSFIFITLATFLLVNGCSSLSVRNDLERAGKEEAACARTAANFYPSSGPIQIRQNLTPYNGLDKVAWALAEMPDRSLVIGGDFTVAGGVAARHVARWNPVTQVWSAMGAGLPQPVHELVSTPGNDLYALTWFMPETFSTMVEIYRWSGLEWEMIPQPFNNPLAYGQSVDAMVWDGGSGFFLGGSFTAAAGLAVNGMIHWDDSTWRALEGRLPLKGLFMVQSLAFSQDKTLYAGGILKSSASELTNRVFAWDGNTWTTRGEALPGPVEALALSKDGHLIAVNAAANNKSTSSSDKINWFSLEFDERAQKWVRVSSGYPGVIEGLRIDENNGRLSLSRFPADLPQNAIETWDGSLIQGRGNPFDLKSDQKKPIRLYALNGKVYVLGAFEQIDGTFPADNIAVWDGQAWQNMSGAQKQPVYGVHGEIIAMVIDHHGILTAGGEFKTAGSSLANNIARWDGRGWQPLGSGLNGRVTSLVVDGQDRVYAGGNFSQAGGIQVRGVARWDPATGQWEVPIGASPGAVMRVPGAPLWDPTAGQWETPVGTSPRVVMPIPDFSQVQVIAFGMDGRLYVASTYSGGSAVAAWDGRSWQQYPGYFDKEILALFADRQGRLYVGGRFSSVSGQAAHGLASWNSESKAWFDLGASLTWSASYNSIQEIMPGPDGSLYVGGNFRSAGDKPLCHIARLLPLPGSEQFEWTQLGGGLPWLQRMALGPDGSLYAISTLPRENGESDWQAVVLSPGSTHWSLVDGVIGQGETYNEIDSLAIDPNGLLYVGGLFSQAGGYPVDSFAIFRWDGQ